MMGASQGRNSGWQVTTRVQPRLNGAGSNWQRASGQAGLAEGKALPQGGAGGNDQIRSFCQSLVGGQVLRLASRSLRFVAETRGIGVRTGSRPGSLLRPGGSVPQPGSY